MDDLSLLDQIKLIFTYFSFKEPEWQSLADKVHIQFARNTLKLLMGVSVLLYTAAGKYQNVFAVLVVNSFLLLVMNKKTIIIMKILSIMACLGMSWVRFTFIGKETILYNQIHTSLTSLAILLLTGSYKITTICFLYIYFFAKWNGQIIIKEYISSPLDFQHTLQYFIDNYSQFNFLLWTVISLIVYQHQVLLAQLWAKQKEKEDLLYEVQKKNQELEKLYQSKNKFLLGLSHEFRNPINAALGNLELANEKILDPIVQKHLTNCKVAIEMLFHLVSNLLDSTKIESGILELNPLRKDSRAMFHKVWSIVKNLFDKQNLVGEFYIHKKIPAILKIDSHIMVKILLNLILNAIKYTHEGAVVTVITWLDGETVSESMLRPTEVFYSKFLATYTRKSRLQTNTNNNSNNINRLTEISTSIDNDLDIPLERCFDPDEVSFHSRFINTPSIELVEMFQNTAHHYEKLTNAQNMKSFSLHPGSPLEKREILKQKGFLKIEVIDSGCGMDDEIVKKSNIFEKFSSLSLASEDRLGLGLGLWLTKNLCELMGGQVKAFSEKGKGSQFVAIVPAKCLDSMPFQKELLRSRGSSSSVDSDYQSKLSAMVVDDDKYNREINTMFLTRAGVEVKSEAVNGQEAVDIFKSKPPAYYDIILMDLEMPIMNGKEAVRRIRRFEKEMGRLPTKVIIATGNCDLKEYNECMDRNGDIQANFFYRKPLTKKDFEEFVEALRKVRT